MAIEYFTFKRGDTFKLTCTTPRSLDGFAIECHLRDPSGVLVDRLAVSYVSIAAEESVFTLTATTPTESWPLKKLRADVKVITDTGAIRRTNTWGVDVQESETRGS